MLRHLAKYLLSRRAKSIGDAGIAPNVDIDATMFYLCSMSEAALVAEQQRLLSSLAELSLAVAEDVQAAVSGTDDPAEVARLTDAFCKVGRCMRMAIALSMRLSRGERTAPAREGREDAGLELDLEDERDDWDDDEERPEGLERESLYDRLPSGDLPTQIGAIARTLAAAARALPGPAAQTWRTRCEALAAEVAVDLPEPPPRTAPPIGATIVRLDPKRAPTRARGPPAPG